MDFTAPLICFLALHVSLGSGEPLPAADPLAQKPKSLHGTKPDLSVLIKPLPNGLLQAVQDDIPAEMAIGSSFDLDCHITPGGEPNADVRWLKNGRRFVDSARAKVIAWLGGNQFEDYQIRFFNFTNEDAGRYTCMTPQGSINATLGVRPYLTGTVTDIQLFAGEPLDITCPVSAYPPVAYTWVEPSRDVLPAKGHSLHITAAKPKMNGTFECEGRNSIGQASMRINVLVKEHLVWTETSPRRVVSHPLSTVQLKCHARGYPRSQVLWTVQRKGKPLERVITNETDGELTLFLVTEATSGNYTCAVRSLLPCCDDEQAQPPLLKTITLLVQERYVSADLPTPCPDDDSTCQDGSRATSVHTGSVLALAIAALAAAVVAAN